MNDRPIGPGHNQPGPLDRAAELVANANRWRTERPEITSDDQARAADDFVTQLRGVRDELDAALKRDLEPIKAAETAARLSYRNPRELVQLALDGMLATSARWLQKLRDKAVTEAAEKKRQADEAERVAITLRSFAGHERTVEGELEAQRATEEAARLAKQAARPVERPRIRGDYSGKAMSLRTRWRAVIDDPKKALRAYGEDRRVVDAVQIAANDDARSAKDAAKAPAGVRFINEEFAQ
jgi:hypothetical protein